MIYLFNLPPRKRLGLKNMVRIAANRAEYKKGGWDGYRTSTGRIYLRCIFHNEKTPSLVVYRREVVYAFRLVPKINGELDWSEWRKLGPRDLTKPIGHRTAHYHCYGCRASGSYSKLLRAVRKIHADAELLEKYRTLLSFATGCTENETGQHGDLPF